MLLKGIRKSLLLAFSLFFIVAALPLLFPSCPRVPNDLSSRWQYLGSADGTLVFHSPSDARSTAEAIIYSYGTVYYYARSTDASELNLQLSDLPPAFDVVYIVTVPDNCGAETYAIVPDGDGSKVYVGIVPISDRLASIHHQNLFCEPLASLFGSALSVSELLSKEESALRQYCYVRTAEDLNSIHDVLSSRGDHVGAIGGARIYHLDNNVFVNVVPGNPAGLIAYKTVNGRDPQ